MKKRIISIFLLVSMLFTMLPSEAMFALADNLDVAANSVQHKMKIENPFVDVREGSWYFDAVQYSRINGFFKGTSEKTFDPEGPMTRGMFVTVLGHMAGVDQAAYMGQSTFSDVAVDAYYAPFVAWASKHGIAAGVENSKFDPEGLVTREQMAAFFVCYFEKFGVDFETGANITTVPADLESVSPWARDMVLKLWRTGLLAGDGTNFNPKANASRAQAAALCMNTDKTVKTWYSEPGVPSDRISVDPNSEQISDTPDSSEDDSNSEGNTDNSASESNTEDSDKKTNTGGSNGGSKTTYYKIKFVVESTKEEKLYQEGTLLSSLPVPGVLSGKVFLGWYYDAEYINPVAGNDKLSSDITLYAKLTDGIALDESGMPNFISVLDQKTDFTISVKKADGKPVSGTDFKFRNITAPDKTPEGSVSEEDLANIESVKVEGSNGVWTISSANGGFTPGHTYQIELTKDDVIYDDSIDAFKDLKAINGYDIAQVRFFNFSIEKDGTLNLKLNEGIKYIPVNKLNAADGASLMEYAGLYLASTDEEGNTTYTPNNGSGSFTYNGSEKIQVGDTVAVYSGTKPTERKPEKGTKNKTDNGEVSYIKIIKVENNTYYYVAAEAEDVLFTPDVLPIDVDENDGTTGWQEKGTSVIIDNDKLDFSDTKYEIVGLSSETTVDVGDFLAFYTGDFGNDNAQDLVYGEITKIIDNKDGTTTIIYKEVKEDRIMSAMDMYDETQINQEKLKNALTENEDTIIEIVEAQLKDSKFFDEAGEYLAELALKTDEVREVFGDDLTLSDCTITYADGTPIGTDELTLMGNIVDKDQKGKKPKVSFSISTKTSHFDPKIVGSGVRVEVAVSYEFKIQKKGNNNIIEVNLTAFFEQEFTFGFNVSGGAVWKWKWKIIPYISDYRLTGNLDIGTYTGVGITATAKLTQKKEPWGMPWPNNAKEAAATKKIFTLSESIKKLMKDVETFLPEEEATASGGLAEKYANFMEDANEEWVDLVSVSILDLHTAADPLHILAFGLQVDFVVSANLNVAIGMTFQYENFKRHSFTLLVLSKKGESETIDLSTNGYQFDFYVMGTIGIRAGVRVKVTAGLFSTKIAGVGLQFETGAYARMWGYFYYHLENWKENGVWQKNSGYSGGLLIEIGAYLDVKFIAEALNGKYSYTPTIYAKEWPLWSAGQREVVYDFAYKDDQNFNILNVNTYTIPKTVFDMYWMDIKSGDIEKVKNYDSNTAPEGDDEAYFIVDLSNPAFSYNPKDNKITINTSSGAVTQSCDMVITWKGTSLTTSSDTLSRTIKLNWSNEANAGTIAFDSNGGSAVQMLRLLAGTALSGKMPAAPTRFGYTFAGWYTDKDLKTAFNATTMPKGNTTLYAKWTPNDVNYTVEHYQKSLDGQYVLVETDKNQKGKVDTQTTAVAKSYIGFTAQTVKQQTIMSDGSTRVAIYYDRNSYDLKLVYGNGSNDVTLKVPYEATIVKPSNPTKEGYTFAGWDADIPQKMPANALTFTAKWKASTNTRYTVKHYKQELNEEYVLENVDGMFGTTGQETSAAARNYTGFTAKKFEQKTILPDGSTVVEIYYNRNFNSLLWNLSGAGEDIEDYVMYGWPINSLYIPTRAGYSFVGWYRDAALTTPLEENATMPDVALILYAKWKANQYTITFDSNGGSAVAAITQDYGTKVEAPVAPTKSGYSFAGWKLNGVDYTFTTMPAENITLVAEWGVVSNIPYTVEHYWEELDGSYPETPNDTEHLNGSTGAMVTANAKGYTGFTYDPNANGTISSGIVAIDGSLVLKLYYKRNSYNVIWNGNGGNVDTTGATTGSVKYGAAIDSPVNNPIKTGYTFKKWSGYAANMTMPAENITFIAEWTVNQYTITFDSNGGSKVQAITQDYGTNVNVPTAPTKAGFKFVGWQLNGEDYTFTTMPAEDIILVAVWDDVPTYTVTFDANGGTVGQTDKYVYEGETYGELPVPNNGDKFFLGWYTAKSSGTKVTSETVVELAANHTLYACWADTGFTGSVYPNLTIYVAGIKVTTENMNDILGDGSGSVQFDPNSTVVTTSGSISNAGNLYLNNATISGTSYYSSNNAAIYTSYSMTIVNTGNSTVTNTFDDLFTNNNVYGIYIGGIANIEGSGTLTVTSGQGGAQYNCGIRSGLSGAHLTIEGLKVEVFAGTAGNNGKSYGACVGPLDMKYKVFLNQATLEAHGYDSAVYCGDPNFPYTDFLTVVNTYIGGTDYDGTDAESVIQTEEYQYRNYKYILATYE